MLYEATLFSIGLLCGWFYARLYEVELDIYNYNQYPKIPPPPPPSLDSDLSSLDEIIQETESLEGESLDFLLLEKKDN